MKALFQNACPAAPKRTFVLGTRFFVAWMLMLGLPLSRGAVDAIKTFGSAEDAVSALVSATSTKDNEALHAIFGPAGASLENPDRVQSAQELNAFTTAFNQAHRLVRESEAQCVLEVGTDAWAFPVPIVKTAGRWHFDTQAGVDELLSRRIGKNELSALQAMRAYVDAQREYASADRDGDGVLEYAQRLSSSPGRTDGLYWPAETSPQISPLGPFVAQAQTEGYFATSTRQEAGPQPFHGYLFKILTRQGPHAPGGKFDYVINGNMICGFALVGWPAVYGDSGVMTFIVNQQGRVYEKDLGEDTAKIVKRMRAYDPDSSWHISRD